MINCIVVDDEPHARELIKLHLSQLDGFNLVASCASAIEAGVVLNENDIDLIFLDIQMPVLKGVDFYHGLANKPDVIFTTAHRDYAVEGFDLNAVDYLLKPISFARFFKAVERVRRKPVSEATSPEDKVLPSNGWLLVREDRKNVRLNLDDILYIKSLKDYLEIYMKDEKHIIKETISAMESRLPNNFIRSHRSYIVNTNEVTAFTKYDLELGELEIPIGESYREAVNCSMTS